MQRLQDAARHGYAFYVTGETSEEKWPALAAKFSEIYLCALPKSTRSKRRKSGEAVTMLYAYQDPYKSASGAIVWALMVTDGRGRVHARETLLQLTKDRFVLGGYELVHDGVGWSWKMTREGYGCALQRARFQVSTATGWDACPFCSGGVGTLAP